MAQPLVVEHTGGSTLLVSLVHYYVGPQDLFAPFSLAVWALWALTATARLALFLVTGE